MSQTYTDDCFDAGHVALTDLQNMENNFAALKSSFSGTDAPSNPVAGMWWWDTTSGILKIRNNDNNAWLSIWNFINNKVILTNTVSADFGAAMKDAVAATASLRTLGTGATQALPGNHPITPVDGSVTPAKIVPYAAGDFLITSADTERNTASTDYVKLKSIQIFRAGTLRIKFELKESYTVRTAYGRVYRNGNAVGAEQTTSGAAAYVLKSEDISGWSIDDTCELWAKINNSTDKAYVKEFRLYSTNPFVERVIMD